MPTRHLSPLGPVLLCLACAVARDDGRDAAAPVPHERRAWEATTTDGTFAVGVELAGAAPPFNEPFELEVTLAEAAPPGAAVSDAEVLVSAWMPAHGHGMNRYPAVEPLGDGRYRVRGMLLHMLGHWELYVDVVRDRLASRAVFEVDL